MPREHDPFDRHRHERGDAHRTDPGRAESDDPVQRVADGGEEHRSWRDRRHPDEREGDAGGTYAFRDQSEASRRSQARTDQHYDDSGMGYGRERDRSEREYGRRDDRHSGYGSSGQGQYGRGGYAQGGYGQSGVGQDYGQRDVTRTDAAQGLHPDHDLDPDYLDWRRSQLSSYDRDYAHWRESRAKEHDDEYRRWRGERRSNFHQSFSSWRSGQTGLNAGVNTQAMQPGLSANAAEISHGTGPGPVDGDYSSDPKVVGDRNAGDAAPMAGASSAGAQGGGSSAATTTGSLGMSPEANPALSNLAGGGSGRSRTDGDKH